MVHIYHILKTEASTMQNDQQMVSYKKEESTSDSQLMRNTLVIPQFMLHEQSKFKEPNGIILLNQRPILEKHTQNLKANQSIELLNTHKYDGLRLNGLYIAIPCYGYLFP